MNNRERTWAIMHYEDYDRLPLVHFGFWKETPYKWAAEGHITQEEAGDWNVVARKLGFDFVPETGVFGGVAKAGNDAYVVVTSFADGQSASALDVRAVLEVAASVGAEKKYHFNLRYKVADFFRDEH